jgi:2,3-bisphosphoglycerate-independent phosphoglycerate mutase
MNNGSRRRVIFIFLDGVGMGPDDPAINPLAAACYPTLGRLLEGVRPVLAAGRRSLAEIELVPTDARLGIAGRPQSATGQAAILTGINAPQRLGEHYGPRPDSRVRAILDEGGIFRRLHAAGRTAHFCNAYPARYFEAVQRGRRLLSAVPYAAVAGGQTLLTHADILEGRALAADFTNQGWRDELGYADVPVYAPVEAGHVVWQMAQAYDFLFFEHWQTDVLGHDKAVEPAIHILQRFDGFLAGLLEAADLERTLILVGSDHGNVEDCSHGKHTENPALALVLGAERRHCAAQLHALTDFVPIVLDFLGVEITSPPAAGSTCRSG